MVSGFVERVVKKHDDRLHHSVLQTNSYFNSSNKNTLKKHLIFSRVSRLVARDKLVPKYAITDFFLQKVPLGWCAGLVRNITHGGNVLLLHYC